MRVTAVRKLVLGGLVAVAILRAGASRADKVRVCVTFVMVRYPWSSRDAQALRRST
jgi:hypothetical protein